MPPVEKFVPSHVTIAVVEPGEFQFLVDQFAAAQAANPDQPVPMETMCPQCVDAGKSKPGQSMYMSLTAHAVPFSVQPGALVVPGRPPRVGIARLLEGHCRFCESWVIMVPADGFRVVMGSAKEAAPPEANGKGKL